MMVKKDEFLKLSEQFLEQSRRFAEISDRYDKTVNLFRKDITKGVEALGEIRDGINAFQGTFSKLVVSYGVISKDMAESKDYLREIRDLMKKQSKK
jgi:hypothetical protein